MRFPGYWVVGGAGKVAVYSAFFDDTDLDPATDFKEAWTNQDPGPGVLGFVDNGAALEGAIKLLARADLPPLKELREDALIFESVAELKAFFSG